MYCFSSNNLGEFFWKGAVWDLQGRGESQGAGKVTAVVRPGA